MTPEALASEQEAERAWLVNYCLRLCGDLMTADDLAQETLIAAWEDTTPIPPGVGRRAWLAGIARHRYLRWSRRIGREHQWAIPLSDDLELAATEQLDDIDRQELANLLSQALGLLPATTRTALIAHYIDEEPYSAIAQRLNVSEGALAVRLHRGRLALANMLGQDARFAPGGVDRAASPAEKSGQTRLWCFLCGRQRLNGFLDSEHGILKLWCPDCGKLMDHGVAVKGMKTYGAALNRVIRWISHYYVAAAEQGVVICHCCGRSRPTTVTESEQSGLRIPHLEVLCPCQALNICSGLYMSMLTPTGLQFWSKNDRFRFDNLHYVETDYGPTGVVTFISLTNGERYIGRFARETLRVLPPGES